MKNSFAKMVAGACAVVWLTACAGGPNERSTGEVIDDTTILAKTKAALVNDPEIKGTKVDVDVKLGVVTLTGAARNEREKKKILETVWGVNGVKSVQTNISIEPLPKQ